MYVYTYVCIYIYIYNVPMCLYTFICIYKYVVIRQITLNGPAGYTCQASYLSSPQLAH